MDTISVSKDNVLLALIFKKKIKADGVKFLTPISFPLQIGLIEHPKDKQIRPHIHRDLKYDINIAQEFLYIEKGRIEVTIYDNKWEIIKTAILKAGDFILFTAGGHSLITLKKTRIIEIKQGPYPGDKLAKIFKED